MSNIKSLIRGSIDFDAFTLANVADIGCAKLTKWGLQGIIEKLPANRIAFCSDDHA